MGWLLDDVYDGLLYARAARHFAAALAKARNRSTWVPTCVANHHTLNQLATRFIYTIQLDPTRAAIAPPLRPARGAARRRWRG